MSIPYALQMYVGPWVITFEFKQSWNNEVERALFTDKLKKETHRLPI